MFSSKCVVSKVIQNSIVEIRRQFFAATSVSNSNTVISSFTENGNTIFTNFKKEFRCLSTSSSLHFTSNGKKSALPKEQSREFLAVFPDIVRDLTGSDKHKDVPEAGKWLAKILQYNVPGGKKNRGHTLVECYKLLQDPKHLTPENIRQAIVMGWCVEMFQAYFMVVDDIMDGATLRRGVPCWYQVENVGLSAINDAMFIYASIYSILKKYFHSEPFYQNSMEMFNEMMMKTGIGQFLDVNTSSGDKPDLTKFTMKWHNSIVKYKTSYYTFQLPVGLALLMSGIDDPETHRQAKTILLEIGLFYQIQDDFLDCYGDPALMGKRGTDIASGRCSWLAVVALQRANPAQRKIMEQYYGTKNPDDVEKVKALYEDLGLRNTYDVYEEDTYNLIKTHIQQLSKGLPHIMFVNILDKIYKRRS